jgi:hypothetical protein
MIYECLQELPRDEYALVNEEQFSLSQKLLYIKRCSDCFSSRYSLTSAEAKKMWIYTSAPPYAFIAWCLISWAQGQLYSLTGLKPMGSRPPTTVEWTPISLPPQHLEFLVSKDSSSMFFTSHGSSSASLASSSYFLLTHTQVHVSSRLTPPKVGTIQWNLLLWNHWPSHGLGD